MTDTEMETVRNIYKKERIGYTGKRPRCTVPAHDSYDADTERSVPFRRKSDMASENALRPVHVNDSYIVPKDERKRRLISRLAKWATSQNIKADAMDSLLKILRKHEHGLDFLPASAAALELAARSITPNEKRFDVADTSNRKFMQSVNESVRDMKQSVDELRTDVKSDMTRMEALLMQILNSVDKSQLTKGNSSTSVTLMEDIIPQPMRDVAELERFIAEKLHSNAKKFAMVSITIYTAGLVCHATNYGRVSAIEQW